MWIVHELLAQTTNHAGWVIVGLIAWGCAYWQLEDVGAEVLGDIVTLILATIPLGIAAIAIDVAVARWGGNGLVVAFFLILGIGSVLYFVAVYFGWTRVGKSSEVQRVINDYKVLWTSPQKTVKLVIQLLAGAISTLLCVTLLIFGGWELIHASKTIGFICGFFGVALMFLSRYPDQDWNYVWIWRSKLKAAGDKGVPASSRDLGDIWSYVKGVGIKSRGTIGRVRSR